MATKTIKLPSGATAVIKDPKELKQKDRRKVYEAVGDGSATLASGAKLNDSVIAVIVESWTLDLLPPSVKIESLDDLSIDDYDALQTEAEVMIPVLFPRLTKDLAGESDPKVPTGDSNG
jgi:hypothetical protein